MSNNYGEAKCIIAVKEKGNIESKRTCPEYRLGRDSYDTGGKVGQMPSVKRLLRLPSYRDSVRPKESGRIGEVPY